MKHARVAMLCLGALLGASQRAHASPAFPEALRSKLGLVQAPGPAPGCRLCHQTDAGGLKTVTEPFGRAVLAAGAVGGSVPSLQAALDTLSAQATDSDFDGVSDIAELEAGSDPNTAPEGTMTVAPEVPLPQTGCAVVSIARPGSRAPLLAWLVAGLSALIRRKRR
jgi:hypothetical protein